MFAETATSLIWKAVTFYGGGGAVESCRLKLEMLII